LVDMGIRVSPSSANFILFSTGIDANMIWQRLLEEGVLVRNCSSWPRLEGWLRLTIGSEDENNAFLRGLESAVKQG